MDPMVQNNLPTFLSQLRLLLGNQAELKAHSLLVQRYLTFDDEMAAVAAQWAAAEARVQEFGQEQATLKAKQRMLREDCELLRAQRKLLHSVAGLQVGDYPATVGPNGGGSHTPVFRLHCASHWASAVLRRWARTRAA